MQPYKNDTSKKKEFIIFFVGLNVEFDAMRVQILGNEDLPPLNEAISIVHVGGQRGVMLDISPTESSALITIKGSGLDKQPRE